MEIMYENKLLDLKIDEQNENVEVTIPLSDTKIVNVLELGILDVDSIHFASIQTKIVRKELVFSFQMNNLHFWKDAQKLTYLEKLRLCMNVFEYHKYIDLMTTCSLNSNNMLFDENLIPITLYRGIRGKIFPYTFTVKDFFENYRALVLTTLYSKFSFLELIEGAYPLIIEDAFVEEIARVKDAKMIYQLLAAEYQKEKGIQHKYFVTISKILHNVYTLATYILCLLVVFLGGFLIYIVGDILPYKEDLLQAHNYFLEENYLKVIESLKTYSPIKLPKSNQFELAISYIQVENISFEQKQEFDAMLNINADVKYFQYWIYSGMGALDDALDSAKKIDDNKLIILILEKKMTAIKNDEKLTGNEREEQLIFLQNEVKKYIESSHALIENNLN